MGFLDPWPGHLPQAASYAGCPQAETGSHKKQEWNSPMKRYQKVSTKAKSKTLSGAPVGNPMPMSKFEISSLISVWEKKCCVFGGEKVARCRSQSEKKYIFLKREGKDKMSPQKNITCMCVYGYLCRHMHMKVLNSSAHLLLFQKNKILVKYLQAIYTQYHQEEVLQWLAKQGVL